jgi:hypothetical protein
MTKKISCSKWFCYNESSYVIDNKYYCHNHMIIKCNNYKKNDFLCKIIKDSYKEFYD